MMCLNLSPDIHEERVIETHANTKEVTIKENIDPANCPHYSYNIPTIGCQRTALIEDRYDFIY